MYLSRLEFNLKSRRVQKELANRYELHRTLMHAFKPELPGGERLLFRLETERGSAEVLVQTQNLPNWAYFREDAGFIGYMMETEPQVKPFTPEFKMGQKFYFRLLANPTYRKAGYKNKKGHSKRIGIKTEEDQIKWLMKKGQAGGFLPFGELVLKNMDSLHGVQVDGNEKHIIKIDCVQFDGLLEVTNPEEFEQTFRSGIGSARGFGCGLLSLARA